MEVEEEVELRSSWIKCLSHCYWWVGSIQGVEASWVAYLEVLQGEVEQMI